MIGVGEIEREALSAAARSIVCYEEASVKGWTIEKVRVCDELWL